MNNHPDFKAFFTEISQTLLLLGREPDMVNLFFTEGPDTASILLDAIRANLTLPCLMVEFYDEDNENAESQFKMLTSAFIVLDQADKQTKGKQDIEDAIYLRCKPAADQIFAKMKMLSERMQLILGGRKALLLGESMGNWVGPLHNDLYGWRIEFKWRMAGGSCYDPAAWQPK